MLSRGMCYRFQEYKVGGVVLRIEKLEVPFEGGHGPKGAVSTISGWMDGFQTNSGTNPASYPEGTSVKVAKARN